MFREHTKNNLKGITIGFEKQVLTAGVAVCQEMSQMRLPHTLPLLQFDVPAAIRMHCPKNYV